MNSLFLFLVLVGSRLVFPLPTVGWSLASLVKFALVF